MCIKKKAAPRQKDNGIAKRHYKSSHFHAQMKRVFAAFNSQPKTMLMVEVETGIRRSNITRFVAIWHKQNCIKIVRLGICPISKRAGVQFLTTNPIFMNPSKNRKHE